MRALGSWLMWRAVKFPKIWGFFFSLANMSNVRKNFFWPQFQKLIETFQLTPADHESYLILLLMVKEIFFCVCRKHLFIQLHFKPCCLFACKLKSESGISVKSKDIHIGLPETQTRVCFCKHLKQSNRNNHKVNIAHHSELHCSRQWSLKRKNPSSVEEHMKLKVLLCSNRLSAEGMNGWLESGKLNELCPNPISEVGKHREKERARLSRFGWGSYPHQ